MRQEVKQAAAQIKTRLKDRYPEVKFSVKSYHPGIHVRYPGNALMKVAPDVWQNTNAASLERREIESAAREIAADVKYEGILFVERK